MDQTDLKYQLYMIVVKALMLFSVFSMAGNLILHLPLGVNIKWVFLLSLSCLMFFTDRYKGFSEFKQFLFFMFLITIFMPFSFIDAGGGKSDMMVYIFFALIVITYIFDGWYRSILVVAIILVFMGVHTFEYLYPESIPVYNVSSRYVDRLIQVPIVMLFSFILVRRFANAYNTVNQRLLRLANYDALTGLLNRRNLNDILQNKYDAETQKGFLVIMDVDNFKLINDKKGHLAGDDALIHLSSSQLNRFLKKKYNMTFKQKHIERQIESAKDMLVNSDLPIREIAEKMGYASEGNFTAFFKRVLGVSPKVFRKQSRLQGM